jgi:hypothetical protein
MKILITGGTNGMGKGVAGALAATDKQSHEVIIVCRSRELGEATISELEALTNNKRTSIIICDLAKLGDVRNAIEEIRDRHKFLDCIFINAGLGYVSQRLKTEDGMDPHFQVNYLSQFMLTLNLLDLLEKSENGGRVIFNATRGGKIAWDDIQMEKKWSYERGIFQAMAAKKMLISMLHHLYSSNERNRLAFIGFEIPKTVWSNQVNIIPAPMRIMAKLMKFLGNFITIEKCGEIMAPLFTENSEISMQRSGKLITWKEKEFLEIKKEEMAFSKEALEKLWKISLELCNDEETFAVSDRLNESN